MKKEINKKSNENRYFMDDRRLKTIGKQLSQNIHIQDLVRWYDNNKEKALRFSPKAFDPIRVLINSFGFNNEKIIDVDPHTAKVIHFFFKQNEIMKFSIPWFEKDLAKTIADLERYQITISLLASLSVHEKLIEVLDEIRMTLQQILLSLMTSSYWVIFAESRKLYEGCVWLSHIFNDGLGNELEIYEFEKSITEGIRKVFTDSSGYKFLSGFNHFNDQTLPIVTNMNEVIVDDLSKHFEDGINGDFFVKWISEFGKEVFPKLDIVIELARKEMPRVIKGYESVLRILDQNELNNNINDELTETGVNFNRLEPEMQAVLNKQYRNEGSDEEASELHDHLMLNAMALLEMYNAHGLESFDSNDVFRNLITNLISFHATLVIKVIRSRSEDKAILYMILNIIEDVIYSAAIGKYPTGSLNLACEILENKFNINLKQEHESLLKINKHILVENRVLAKTFEGNTTGSINTANDVIVIITKIIKEVESILQR